MWPSTSTLNSLIIRYVFETSYFEHLFETILKAKWHASDLMGLGTRVNYESDRPNKQLHLKVWSLRMATKNRPGKKQFVIEISGTTLHDWQFLPSYHLLKQNIHTTSSEYSEMLNEQKLQQCLWKEVFGNEFWRYALHFFCNLTRQPMCTKNIHSFHSLLRPDWFAHKSFRPI